jgi:hypothetical protein
VLEGGLSLGLKGDNDKADKDIDHEEGNDDDVDEVEQCNNRPTTHKLYSEKLNSICYHVRNTVRLLNYF